MPGDGVPPVTGHNPPTHKDIMATVNPPNPRRQSQRAHAPDAPAATEPTPPGNQPPPFSWLSSLLTMLILIGAFGILCLFASSGSTMFALKAAQPMYALYPPLVAAMLIGGVCGLICYLPTILAVVCFQILFDTDIRKGNTPPAGMRRTRRRPILLQMVSSLLRDGSDMIKLALVVTPIWVMAVGRPGEMVVENKSLEAAAGGQLAAAIMTLRIMVVGMREIWALVPLVVLRWDRDARR